MISLGKYLITLGACQIWKSCKMSLDWFLYFVHFFCLVAELNEFFFQKMIQIWLKVWSYSYFWKEKSIILPPAVPNYTFTNVGDSKEIILTVPFLQGFLILSNWQICECFVISVLLRPVVCLFQCLAFNALNVYMVQANRRFSEWEFFIGFCGQYDIFVYSVRCHSTHLTTYS